MKKTLALVAALLGWTEGLHAGGWELTCPDDLKALPRLVAEGDKLEPSGVAWDPVRKVALGVSDEATPHALFVFDPARVEGEKKNKTIPVTPLLTPRMVETLNPADLEGITRLPDGSFLASASHGIKKTETQDLMLRFNLVAGDAAQPWRVESMRRIPPTGPGFRAWLTQSGNPPWDKKLNTLKSETGINVEGVAAAGEGDLLYLGFRSPILDGRIPVLSFRLGNNDAPEMVKWHGLKLGKGFDAGGIMGFGKEPVGIRDMTALGRGSEFLLLLGASGSGSDIPFQLGVWRQEQEEITWVGKIPEGFRAEGVTVVSEEGEPLRLLLVSDKGGLVMECQAVRK